MKRNIEKQWNKPSIMKSSISSVPILSSLQRSSKLTSDVDSPSDMNVKTRILCTLFSWNKPGKKIKDLDVPLSYFATYYKYIKWFTIISPPNHLAINEIATKKSADSWPSFFFKLINPSPSSCRCLLFPLLHAEKGPFSACDKGNRRRLHAGNVHHCHPYSNRQQCPNIP